MELRRTCASALVIVLAGCAAEAQWVGVVRDSVGIAIVENPPTGMWEPGAEWTLEEELRIGALEGEPDYQFGQVGWIAVDSQGRVHVLDAQAQEIKIYSSDGEYLSTVGKQGSGPGELTGAVFLLMGPGDTLLVPDVQNQRINRYAPDGTSVGEVRIDLQQGIPVAFRSTESGVVASQVRPLGLPNQPTTDSMDAVIRLAADGSGSDTLMTFPSGKTFSFSGGAPEFHIYSPEPIWDLTSGMQLIFAVNDEYRITRYAGDGTIEAIITRPFERKPVTQGDQDAFMRFVERQWRDQGIPQAAVQQLRSAIHFGEFFPAFATLAAGSNGTIWVQHIQRASDLTEEQLESYNLFEDTGAPEWDVFDADGRLLGVVNMPERFTPRIFRGEKVYGVWRDELDVQYVMRYRIVGLAEGATD